MMPIVSQVPNIFFVSESWFLARMGAHRGSLDEVVNNPLELDLLRDFPLVLGMTLGPKIAKNIWLKK